MDIGEFGGRGCLEAARHVPGSVERGRGADMEDAEILYFNDRYFRFVSILLSFNLKPTYHGICPK